MKAKNFWNILIFLIVIVNVNESISTNEVNQQRNIDLNETELSCNEEKKELLKTLVNYTKTLVHQVVLENDVTTLKALIDLEIDVSTFDQYNNTPLAIAVNNSNYETAKLLIEKAPQSINKHNIYHQYPLHNSTNNSTKNASCKIAELLIERGAKVDVLDGKNRSALHYASLNNNTECARVLLKHGSSVDLQEFKSKYCNGESCSANRTALYYAAEFGYLEMVKLLIAHGANTSLKQAYESTPLHIASQNGHYEVAKLLIETDSKPIHMIDKRLRYPIHEAASNGHCDILELLLKNGADMNVKTYSMMCGILENSKTPLQLAAQRGFTKCIKILLEYGVNLTTKDYFETPVFFSALSKVESVKLMIEAEPELMNIPDRNNLYPFFYAVKYQYCDVVEFFINNGYDPNTNTTYELPFADHNVTSTALNFAVRFEAPKCIPTLLKHGILINSTDSEGWTSVHRAVSIGNLDLMKLLVEYGSNLNQKTDYGLDIMDIAERATFHKQKIVDYLKFKMQQQANPFSSPYETVESN